ncbi:MAG: hypothetical protein NT105_16260 [Verrucomicrobia bacterium]|nr:hypothetical protein [Verrucomicrobiota bacterium]
MRYILFAMMLMVVTGCHLAVAAEGPLAMTLPEGWRLEYKGDNGVDFYSVTPAIASNGLLMFFKWPPPARPEEIPALVRKLADGFVKAAARTGKYKLTSKQYEVERLEGEHCTGNHAAFWFKSGTDDQVQGIFMLNVDGQIWNGQFTGQSENWLQALRLLKTIKKKG